jgi:hypothetical protein
LTFTPRNIKNPSDFRMLRKMNSLQYINDPATYFQSAAEFWKRYDAGEYK